MLDRIVPGYYHRLDADGAIETSTGCNNVATERAMAERIMIDACVAWVRDYRVDGFRFDLMGHHSVGTMARLREALEEIAEDAVGHPVYLYGEGWSLGEVAGNALFRQACQGQLGELGIGTFNDRVRDAVHGGNFEQADPRTDQGLGNGELTDPNALEKRMKDEAHKDLAWRTDLMRLSLAGNLRDYTLQAVDGGGAAATRSATGRPRPPTAPSPWTPSPTCPPTTTRPSSTVSPTSCRCPRPWRTGCA